MLNVDYSRRLRNQGNYMTSQEQTKKLGRSDSIGNKGFTLFIGAILLFTGGVVVGLHLNQSERQFSGEGSKNTRELSLSNVSNSQSPFTSAIVKDSSLEDSGSFYPKNLKYPPKLDQINYVIEIGVYEPTESGKVGKLIIQESPEFQGKIFQTSTGKLFSGYYYKKEDAEQALNILRSFEKDDFTDAVLKTVRF